MAGWQAAKTVSKSEADIVLFVVCFVLFVRNTTCSVLFCSVLFVLSLSFASPEAGRTVEHEFDR
jgi:hypothetical protein